MLEFRLNSINIKPAMTYSRAGRTTIGPRCLSAVFGMGTGVSTWVWSPAVCQVMTTWWALMSLNVRPRPLGRGGDDVAKPSAVSTGRLSASPHVHVRPIDPVVSREPSC